MQSLSPLFIVLAVGPLLFLLLGVVFSVYFAVAGITSPDVVADRVTHSIPRILLAVQVLLLVALWLVKRWQGLTWHDLGWSHAGARVGPEIVRGLVPGLVLGVVYVFALSPLLTTLQTTFGDYVPPGDILPTLRSDLVPFFCANVAFAPFVEETLYRGYALPLLRRRFGVVGALAISCLCFGLLHWMGGIWYILLTGFVAGGMLAALFLWRGNVIAPFSAHLGLNLVEFGFVALT